jgi:hypothetical protein
MSRLGVKCNYQYFRSSGRTVCYPAGYSVPVISPLDSLQAQAPYPVAGRTDFPILIHFCASKAYHHPKAPKNDLLLESETSLTANCWTVQYKMGVTSLTVDSQSLASHMRTTWLQYALSDPCLFHAILFYASARLDSSQGKTGQSPITLYHHSQAVNHINRRLSTQGTAVDDSMIASVALLAMHAVRRNTENISTSWLIFPSVSHMIPTR